MVFQKVDLGGYDLTLRSLKFLGQSSLDFFAECDRNHSQSSTFPILNIFIHSGDIRCQTLKSSEITNKLIN